MSRLESGVLSWEATVVRRNASTDSAHLQKPAQHQENWDGSRGARGGCRKNSNETSWCGEMLKCIDTWRVSRRGRGSRQKEISSKGTARGETSVEAMVGTWQRARRE